MSNSRSDFRVIEVIVRAVKSLKVNKAQEGAVGVDRTIEEAATEVKVDHLISVVVALHTILSASTLRFPEP